MAEAAQLTLGLGHPPAYGRDDFVVGACNREATTVVDSWPDWSFDLVLITGPEGSGKSHLASMWVEASGARILPAGDLADLDWSGLSTPGPLAIEDVDRTTGSDRALFHLINEIRAARGTMLLTARNPDPAAWCTLPDLLSRLRTARPAALQAPDDEVLRMVLAKLFADRQLEYEASLLEYVIRRMERSFAAAAEIVDRIDRVSLASGRAVTRRLAAEVIADTPGFHRSADPAEAK